jgi:phospholipase/carboxylesterase
MDGAAAKQGRLEARPRQPGSTGPIGLHQLGPENDRDGLLLVPASYDPYRLRSLAIMLHGAGGNAQHGLSYVFDFVETAGLILLSPESRGQTWDVITGKYGPDVALIDRLLDETFSQYAIDPSHVAIWGFSDGASYALSLGLINGDLFSHIIAFSPGFMAPTEVRGKPRIFISHGVQDAVLSIDRCSRRIVPQLREGGYKVDYHEFEDGHTVPTSIAQTAMTWYLGEEV